MRLRQPALAVLGEESDTRFHLRHRLLLDWLPNVEPLVVPGVGHLLHVQDPHRVAEGLAAFFGRHPLGTA
jgi:pimeloyl-ACP methyl ester carboxylesterase